MSSTNSGGGACRGFCPSVSLANDEYNPFTDGRDGCDGSWRPQDFGVFLHRSVQWQREVQARGGRMDYNEIVVDGAHWNQHLPDTVEAFFGGEKAREQRRTFLEAFPQLSEVDVPLLAFDRFNWEEPFRLIG